MTTQNLILELTADDNNLSGCLRINTNMQLGQQHEYPLANKDQNTKKTDPTIILQTPAHLPIPVCIPNKQSIQRYAI
jgi:hypothetical protein